MFSTKKLRIKADYMNQELSTRYMGKVHLGNKLVD